MHILGCVSSLLDITFLSFLVHLCIEGVGPNWNKWSAFQSVAVRRATGNDVSGHYFRRYFLFSFFSFSPPSRPFLIERVLGSKNLFHKSCLERPVT